MSPRGIPPLEVSESYLSPQDEEKLHKKQNKVSRRKLPFLQKKNKSALNSSLTEIRGSDNNVSGLSYNDDDDDDISDITTYAEGMPVSFEGLISNGNQVAMNPYQNTEQSENQYAEEAQIHERLNYIVGNYRPPPPYPANPSSDNGGKSMIQQLLEEKNNLQIRDNASMINYCQVDAPKGVSMEDLTKIMQSFPEDERKGNAVRAQLIQREEQSYKIRPHELHIKRSDSMNSCSDDKLVMRTLNSPVSPRSKNSMIPDIAASTESYENKKQFYKKQFEGEVSSIPAPQSISEIYPRDYDADYEQGPPGDSRTSPVYVTAVKELVVPEADYPEAAPGKPSFYFNNFATLRKLS